MPEPKSEASATSVQMLRAISAHEFLTLGNRYVAYVRPVIHDAQAGFALHGADGTPLAFHSDKKVVQGLATENDLDIALLH
jgi:hypothetical protein